MENTGIEILAQLKADNRNASDPLTTADAMTKKLTQYNFNDLIGKNLQFLNGPERVALVMYLVNKQVNELDDLI
jgi:endo-beta-N-acetylglucosaminidase D